MCPNLYKPLFFVPQACPAMHPLKLNLFFYFAGYLSGHGGFKGQKI